MKMGSLKSFQSKSATIYYLALTPALEVKHLEEEYLILSEDDILGILN